MKNKIKRLFYIIVLFMLCLTNVDAKEMSLDEIPNNSYVIGKHIFTEQTTLLTKHIMLASKTITSNNLDDMIVYYKTPRGKWINGADGTAVEAPSKFDIDYIDLEIIETEFNISYILDGGTASNPLIYTALTDDFTLVNPTKEGYLFLGWTGSNGDTPELEVTINKGTTGDLIYIANWLLYGDINSDKELNATDLIFISQYLEGMVDFKPNQTLVADVNTDGEIDDVDVHILAKYVSNGGNKPDGYNISLPYDSGDKYTITYNLNNGSVPSRNPQTYAEISLPYELDNPEKEGYAFLGWTGSNGDTPELNVTLENGTTGNLEFVANWGLYGDANNDGVINDKDTTIILRYLSGKTTEINLITADVNLDGEVDDVDRNIILQFECGFIEKMPYDSGEKYTITYNLDGGINDYRNQTVYAEISLTTKLEKPTTEGYVFLGWTGSNGNVPQLEVEIDNGTTGNLEYTAHWIAKEDIPTAPIIKKSLSQANLYGTLQVEILACDETFCDNRMNKADGIELYEKTLDGYTLVQEMTNKKEYLFSVELNPGEARVFTARLYTMYNNALKVYSNYSNEILIRNENIITYDLNGGINANDNPIGYLGETPYDSLLKEPTKAGYTFIGWTGSNGDEPQLNVSISEETTGKLHYIANWELSDEGSIDKSIPLAPTLTEISGYGVINGVLEVLFDMCETGAYNYPDNIPYGAELYIKTKAGYTLVDSINNDSQLLGTVQPGETKIFVARVYVLDEQGNKVYSPYSNEIAVENKNIITYDLNDGVNNKLNPMQYSMYRPYDSLLETPTKEGYTFIGWTGSNGDTPELDVTIEQGTTGHLQYIANWELNN